MPARKTSSTTAAKTATKSTTKPVAKKAAVNDRATLASDTSWMGAALLRSLDTSDRITRYLVENLTDDAWRAEPAGGKGRGIASIVAHIHNVRLMWLKAIKGAPLPAQLDKDAVTRDGALRALAESHAALRQVVADAVADGGRVKGFKPDVVGFVGYLVAHEAHHRGQATMLARQAGHPVSQKAMFGMWEWGSRGKEVEGAAE